MLSDLLEFLPKLTLQWFFWVGIPQAALWFVIPDAVAVPIRVTLAIVALLISSFFVWRSERRKAEGQDRNEAASGMLALLFVLALPLILWFQPDRNSVSPTSQPHDAASPVSPPPGAPPTVLPRQPTAPASGGPNVAKERPPTVSESPAPVAVTTGDGLRVSAVQTKSSRAGVYALTATVAVSAPTQPFGVAFECDGEVDDAEFMVSHHEQFTAVLQGAVGGDRRVYYIGFSSPQLTPESPMSVTLYSKAPLRILRATQRHPESASGVPQ